MYCLKYSRACDNINKKEKVWQTKNVIIKIALQSKIKRP